jgi:hypothetical protein
MIKEQDMVSNFDPRQGTWQIDWPGRISRHDLVYQTPPSDPMQGLPIGNGEIGVLCWCEGSKIIFAVNKSDLWDDAEIERFHNWAAKEEEFSTTLRHAGRIILDFKLPIFDLFYLSDFNGRLSLADGSIRLGVEGPFGKATIKAFVDHATGTFCCEVESRLKEEVELDLRLERFGSRTFSHWYGLVNRNACLGLGGTKAGCDKKDIYLTHKLTTGTFAVGARVLETNNLKVRTALEHSHAATFSFGETKHKKLSFIVSVTSPGGKNAVEVVKKQLDGVQKQGLAVLSKAHRDAWKEFWLRSLIEFGDEYIDSLWHVTMFYAAASQRGKYPGRFINGLWTWNRDVQNWNFYFHWNQQQTYWPLNAAGHHDLIDSYLNYRFNSLPYAKKDAKEVFKTDGAIVSDVCERRGCNSANEFHNHTPAAQIAMEFWRQYRYTGDRDFLQTQALPYLLEAAKFFESRFEKGKDGKYHAKEATGYEGWILLNDCISELVYGKVLFATVLEALEEAGVQEPRAERWRDIMEHLAPLPTVKADKEFIKKGTFHRGWFKGDAATSDRLLASGFGVKEKQWMTSFLPEAPSGASSETLFELTNMQEGKPELPDKYRDDIRCNDGIFPWVEYSTVFPSGFVGLANKGTDLYNTAVNTVKMFACPGMGWLPLGITLARLGLGSEARKIINAWPMLWQYYSNGWGHYGPLAIMKGESSVVHRMNRVADASLPDGRREKERFPFELYAYRHMGMEAMSVFAGAVNESLLQSHDGVIRVAPAIVDDQNARFTLHAQDGFVVSSEIQKGKPLWIGIKSNLGKTCKVVNPWTKAFVYENGKKIATLTGGTIEFATRTGKQYMIVPNEAVMKNWKTVSVKFAPNDQPKTHPSGYTQLGLPRMF